MKPLKEKISITIDNDILAKLKERAELDDRSLSQYINIILKQHINTTDKKKPWKSRLFYRNYAVAKTPFLRRVPPQQRFL